MSMSPRLLRPANTFSPRSISGLALWLDASDSSTLFQNSDGTTPATASSDPVGYWADRSGNGRHVTQSVSGSRPTISATKQNGRNALAFNGSSQSLSIASYNAENGLPGLTRYVVASMSSAGPTLLTRVYNGGGDSIVSTVSGELRFFAGASAYSAVTSTNYGLLTSGTNIIGSVYDGTAGSVAAGIKPYYNGAAIPPASTTGTLPATLPAGTPGFWIGSNIGVNSFWPGRIIEYISYSRALGNADRQRLERYLASKYGITLAPTVSNADAQDWVNRVYQNGGTVSTATAAAVNTLCDSLESASLRDRFYRMNLFCGGTSGTAVGLNSALVPLYRGPSLGGTQYGGTTDTNFGGLFVPANYSESGGLVGDGSTKYLKTGLASNQLAGGLTGHAALWRGTGTVASTRIALGGSDSDVDDFEIQERSGSTDGAWGKTTFIGSAPANVSGLKMINRSSSTRLDLYSNGSSIVNSTASVVVAPHANEFYVFGGNRNGTLTGPVAFPVFAYSLGVSMDATQATNYYNALAAFQTSMSRT